MGRVIPNAYLPNENNSLAYDELYKEYVELHDYFGRGTNNVMKRLKERKREVSK
jgi:L-ribulokinase